MAAEDAFIPILRNIQQEQAQTKSEIAALRSETATRLGKIENDIQGLMEILVGIAGTLRTVAERLRHLEDNEKA